MSCSNLMLYAGWSLLTVTVYLAANVVYQALQKPLVLSPIVTASMVLALAVYVSGSYLTFRSGTHWLGWVLGPATVAFAVPIYEYRQIVRRNWLPLLVGGVVGTSTSVAFGWLAATLLSVDGIVRLSLLPRSVSTPFAMAVSADIGGIPDMTAIFVVVTGVVGSLLADIVMRLTPLGSSISRGALLGVAAHGSGIARAKGLGEEEGMVAALMMVVVGLINVVVAPLIVAFF